MDWARFEADLAGYHKPGWDLVGDISAVGQEAAGSVWDFSALVEPDDVVGRGVVECD